MNRWQRFLSHLAPAIARPKMAEAIRSGMGAAFGLMLCAVFLGVLSTEPGFVLIAPLGASAFLLFAVPNSPMAQPWPAVVGNTLSALVAVLVVGLALPVPLGAALAVGGAVIVMAVTRSMHPPGAAVALSAVLNAPLTQTLGYGFALAPVALDTAILVGLAVAYNHATGRVYPFRLPPERGAHGTDDPAPERRNLPNAETLQRLLTGMNLGANIGVEDLSRLIVAAEAEAAAQRFGGKRCADIMSRDVVTVAPDTGLGVVADLFRKHRFKTLPVVLAGDLVGIITQTDLIERAREDALSRHRSFGAALAHLVAPARGKRPVARDIMTAMPRVVAPEAALSTLLPLLSDSGVQAAPVVDQGQLVGLITRSDLIAALTH